MTEECSVYRSQIPRSFMGDLNTEQQDQLSRHLAECLPCNQEHQQYAETLRLMRTAADIPVPRHFFVYAEDRRLNPWQVFRRLSVAWQGSIAAVILLLGLFSAAAASKLNVRTENGVLILGLGQPVLTQVQPAPFPVVDVAAIEARVVRILDERNRKERLDWVRALRNEIATRNRSMSEQQRALLATALTDLESRMSGQIDVTAKGLEERTDRSLSGLYRLVSAERERDLSAVDSRLNRLAASGEIKSNQTDAILETLLQVAELGTK
jgi:hypothetical protein